MSPSRSVAQAARPRQPAAPSATPRRAFTITGFAAGATCTATETLPAGYTANQIGCAGVAIANSGAASCTIINTRNSATFTVNKNFSDNNWASVNVSVSCTNGGVPSPASGTVSHAAPRTFTITGFTSGATCTATEALPNGYAESDNCAFVAVAVGGMPSCTITNTLKSGTFVVKKNFSDNSTASVTVTVTCTSGTPSPASGTVSHASPKTFTITGFNSGATCAATETVPAGYTANQTTCASVVVNNGGSVSCTITNTNSATFTVNKNFNDNSSASVTVSVTCSSGTVSPGSGSVSHAAPRIYAITGFSTGATCTATEAIPAGYIETDNCAGVAISNGGTASCTINNRSGSITVCKVIIDAAGNVVDGSAVAGQTLSDAFFQPSPVPSTGAADSVPPTTTWTTPITRNTDLFDGTHTGNDGMCTTYTGLYIGGNGFYYKRETTPATGWATPKYNDQYDIAVDYSTFFPYSGELFDGNPSNDGNRNLDSDGHITLTSDRPDRTLVILNQYNSAQLTVNKVFSPHTGSSVPVSVTCTSGSVSPSSASVSETTPGAFAVTLFNTGATCTASESVPAGYVQTSNTCTSGNLAITNGGTFSCTITNTLNSATFTVNKDFRPDTDHQRLSLLRRQRHRHHRPPQPQRPRQRPSSRSPASTAARPARPPRRCPPATQRRPTAPTSPSATVVLPVARSLTPGPALPSPLARSILRPDRPPASRSP